MRQAILLDNGDLDAMRRGGGLQLEVAPGVTVTLLYTRPRMGRPSVNGNGHHAAAVDLARRVTASTNGASPNGAGHDKLGRRWVMTPARKRALANLRREAVKPANVKKRLAGLRAAMARKRKAKEEATHE